MNGTFFQLCLFRWIRRVGQVPKRGCPKRTVWLHPRNRTAVIHLQPGFNRNKGTRKCLVNQCVTTVAVPPHLALQQGPTGTVPSSAAGRSWWSQLTAATPLSPEVHKGCLTCLRSHFSPCWLTCLSLQQLQFITHQSAQFCSHLWLIIKEH